MSAWISVDLSPVAALLRQVNTGDLENTTPAPLLRAVVSVGRDRGGRPRRHRFRIDDSLLRLAPPPISATITTTGRGMSSRTRRARAAPTAAGSSVAAAHLPINAIPLTDSDRRILTARQKCVCGWVWAHMHQCQLQSQKQRVYTHISARAKLPASPSAEPKGSCADFPREGINASEELVLIAVRGDPWIA